MTKITKTYINKLATHPLQTWEWGKFREKWGNSILYTKHGIITIHHIPKTKYKVATFLRGTKPTATMMRDLKKLAEENNLIFIKLEPDVTYGNSKIKRVTKLSQKPKLEKLLSNGGAVKGKTVFTPTTFQLDITPSEEDLMKSFNSKTRYNIRLASRKGVEVVEDNSDQAFETYLKLMKETVERQRFYAHTEKYHRLMWKYLHTDMKKPIARILTARYKGKIITAWIVFVWKDYLYYPYGASTHEHKKVMANNLMMWEAIRYGKRNKLKVFDLWGREPGKGFTKFKEGYNPDVIEFIGTWDLKTSPLYAAYKGADLARWALLRAKSKFKEPSF